MRETATFLTQTKDLIKKCRAVALRFFITLSLKRKRELPFGSDAIADFMFSEKIEVGVSEQSLFRRFAPYKSLINARNGNISHLKSI